MRIVGAVFLTMNVTTIEGHVRRELCQCHVCSEVHQERNILWRGRGGDFDAAEFPEPAIGRKADSWVWTRSYDFRHVPRVIDSDALSGCGKTTGVCGSHGNRIGRSSIAGTTSLGGKHEPLIRGR